MAESLRILILEDNHADAELVQFELGEAGFAFIAKVVMTEEDFIRELQEYCPDLILSDYDLPKYNGALALAEAKRRCPEIPFILVTGAVTEDRAIDILTQGAKDYVLKNRLNQRLVPAIRRALAEAEEHRARKQAEAELRQAYRTLEERVKTRTAQLEGEMAAREKTQDALQDSEKRYRRLFESAKDGILILDADTGKVVDVNPYLLQLLGYSYDALCGKHIWELGVFKDIAASREAFKTLQDKECIRYDELPLETLDGRSIAVEFVSNVYPVDHHKVVQCNIRDITGRRRVEEEKKRLLNDLQKEKDRLQGLIDGIGDEIWFADNQKRFTLANPSALHEFGLTSHADVIDIQKFAESLEVYRPDGSARPVEEAPPLRALKGEVVKDQEEMIRTPANGEIRYRQVSSNPVRDADGQIIGSVSVVRDITEFKKAEEALRESNAKYRELVQSANSVIIRWKCDGTLVFFNEYAQSLFGYSADEIIGRNVRILVPEKESSGGDLTDLIQDIVAHPTNYINNVNENICRDGRRIWLAWTNKPIFDERGRVAEILAVAVDISERKQAEEKLALNEREFRLLTESMPQIVWTTRVDGWNTYFNQKWVDYTGLTLEESYGHGWNKPFHPDDQQRAWDAWQNAVLHNAPYLLQCRLRRADGIYQWWQIHGVPVLDENGNIIKWYGTCTDINDLKLTEEAMLQSQNQFNSLIKNIRSGVALIDDTGKFTVVNPSFLRMFGLKDDETISNVNDKNWNDWQVFESDGTLLHVDEHPVRKAAITGKPVRDKLVGVRLPSGGDLIWMLISADLVRSPDGSIQSTICTYHDITERTRAEEALRESEERFRLMGDTIPYGAWMADAEGRNIYISPLFLELVGMTIEQVKEFGWTGKMPPEDVEPTMRRWMECIRTGRDWDGEMRFPSPDGRWHTILSRGKPVRDAQGQIKSWIGINLDITERKRAEEILRQSEERYRALFNGMTEGFASHEIITDERDFPVDYRFLDVNRAFEHLTGLRREDVVGKTHNEVLSGDDPNWLRMYGAVALTGEPVQFDNYSPTLKRHYSVMAYRPAPRQFAVIFTDITEIKNREKEQEKSNRTLRALNRSNQAMIQATDERAYMEEVCRIVVEDCGHAMVWIGFAEDDESKTVRPVAYSGFEQGYIDTLKITWADSERGRGPTGTAIREGKTSACRNMLTDPVFKPWREEALRRGYASSIVLPLMSDNKAFGALTIYSREPDPFAEDEVKLLAELASDLSYGIMAIRLRAARERAEKALNERTVQLENTNKELESFSYSVSHDLRAPLRAIDGYARMILRQQGDKFDETTRHQFDVIRNNTKMMGQLIEDLLALSRFGREALSRSRFDVTELTRDVWEELKANNPDRSIDVKIHAIPAGLGDRSLIKQVLVNLLSNAIKFTRDREDPLIEVSGTRTKTENVYFVRDNGVGFDMHYHDKLFGVFQRLHSAGEFEGTGVGLAIVQRIINRHGGRVWAEGEVDKGATFYFSLPTQQE